MTRSMPAPGGSADFGLWANVRVADTHSVSEVEHRSGLGRTALSIIAGIATVGMPILNVWAAYYIADTRCGRHNLPGPSSDSLRGSYCDFVESFDDTSTAVEVVLTVSPTLILIVGVISAVWRRSRRTWLAALLISMSWLALWLVPAAILPGS